MTGKCFGGRMFAKSFLRKGVLELDMMDELRGLGVNVDEAIARVNHNKALYEKMLVKFVNFLKDSMPVLDSTDSQCEKKIEVAHAIKGTSGNLSVVPIYKAYSQIVSLLREGKQEEADELVRNIRPVQDDIINCIEKYM